MHLRLLGRSETGQHRIIHFSAQGNFDLSDQEDTESLDKDVDLEDEEDADDEEEDEEDEDDEDEEE